MELQQPGRSQRQRFEVHPGEHVCAAALPLQLGHVVLQANAALFEGQAIGMGEGSQREDAARLDPDPCVQAGFWTKPYFDSLGVPRLS